MVTPARVTVSNQNRKEQHRSQREAAAAEEALGHTGAVRWPGGPELAWWTISPSFHRNAGSGKKIRPF